MLALSSSFSWITFPMFVCHCIEPRATVVPLPKAFRNAADLTEDGGRYIRGFNSSRASTETKCCMHITQKSPGYCNGCGFLFPKTILSSHLQPKPSLWPFLPHVGLSLLQPFFLCNLCCSSLSLASCPNLLVDLPLHNPNLSNFVSYCFSEMWLWFSTANIPFSYYTMRYFHCRLVLCRERAASVDL